MREPITSAPAFLAHLQACGQGKRGCSQATQRELNALIARCQHGCAYQGPLAPKRKQRPARTFAGFRVGQTLAAARTACVASKRQWQRIEPRTAYCDGFAPSVGMPLRIELFAPRGPVHEIRAYYDAAKDNPHAVLDAVVQLLFGRYGEPSDIRSGYVAWTGSNWTNLGEMRAFISVRRVGIFFVTPP